MNESLSASTLDEDHTPQQQRQLQHRRQIDCCGYRRYDGLWDLEVELHDTKSYDIQNKHRTLIPAGDPIHGMLLRVTVDLDLLIHAVEVRMRHTPYARCPHIEKNYQQAVGMTIKPGFYRQIKSMFHGVGGCTHITEMWYILGTLAYQATFPERAAQDLQETSKGLMGTCHVHASTEKVTENLNEFNPT